MSERPTDETELAASELNGRPTELAIRALPFSIVLAVVAFMVEREGAFALTVWSPLTLLLLGVVATVALSARQLLAAGSCWSIAATTALAAFTVWSFVTILWAGVRGDAWDGSNRTILYLLVFALLAHSPTSVRAVWPTLLAVGTAIAIEGIITVEQAIHASDPTQFVIGSRLSEPTRLPERQRGALHDDGVAHDWTRIAPLGSGARAWLGVRA